MNGRPNSDRGTSASPDRENINAMSIKRFGETIPEGRLREQGLTHFQKTDSPSLKNRQTGSEMHCAPHLPKFAQQGPSVLMKIVR